MSQHDLDIANQGFPATRADINNALQALGSSNSGATAPSTTYANQLWYDTANNIIKIRNEDNDAWISLFTLDQTNDDIAALTINGNLTAEGLRLGDGEYAAFGAGQDLQIQHNGTDSFITDAGTGDLHIRTDTNLNIQNAAGSESKAVFATDGAVTLYHDNAEKLTTQSTGAKVTHAGASANAVLEINNTDTSGDANEGSQISFNEGGSQKTAITSNFQSNSLIIFHEGANRLVIDSAGRILHGGITSNNAVGTSAQLQVSYTKANEFGIHVRPSDNNTGGGQPVLFQNLAGNSIGSISATASNVAYNTSSDHRLKNNVEDMTGAIARIKQLSPKRFSWIIDDLDAPNIDGFLAHEAQAVVPEAVTGTHNQVDDDGNAVMQAIDQSKLVPLLTGALKEAITKIESLETRVAALEA